MRYPRGVLVCWTILHLLLFRGESFVVLSANVPISSGRRRRPDHHPAPQSQSSSRSSDHRDECNRRNNQKVLFSQRGGAGISNDNDGIIPNERISKNHIAVSSQIDLPFSAEIAFDAFSDLPRQSTWSPWLRSVEYIQEGSPVTKWTMKSILGMSYSWNAVHTRLERPYLIEWESCKGLKNWGRVEFIPKEDDMNTTAMRLTLTFVAPRIVARVFQNRKDGKGLSHMVQTRIVGNTLRNFRRVVLTHDVPQKNSTTRTAR